MSPRVLRCLFAGIFLITVASRIHSSSAVSPDDLAVIAGLLERHGLPTQSPQADQSSILFSAPGCDRPLRVQPLSISLEAAPLYEATVSSRDVGHYIYLGEVWPKAAPVALHVEWIKNRVLATLGLAPYRRLRTALFVAEPSGCDAIKRIDWRSFWSTAVVPHG